MQNKKRLFTICLAALLMLGGFLTEPVMAQEGPTFEIGTFDAVCGDTIEVPVWVKNNPGIAAIKLKVAYDDARLELIDVVYGSWSGNFQQPQKKTSPVSLTWYNGTENYTEADSVFATLTFRVLEDAAVGTGTIQMMYEPDNVYNIAENNIAFAVKNGAVNVVETPPVQVNLLWQNNKKTLAISGEPRDAVFIYVVICHADGRVADVACYTAAQVREGVLFTNTSGDPAGCTAAAFVLNTKYVPMTDAVPAQ